MGEFSPPFFSEPPSFFFFSYPSNIEIIFDFSDIIKNSPISKSWFRAWIWFTQRDVGMLCNYGETFRFFTKRHFKESGCPVQYTHAKRERGQSPVAILTEQV